MKKIDLVKPLIESAFPTMRGHERKAIRFDVGTDTPLLLDVEAVTGFVNRDKPATAVYVWCDGRQYRYNGSRWE